MKVELHLHTSRFSACAKHTPEQAIASLVQAGYQAAYITDHDAVWPRQELADLQARFAGIRIFPGIERTIGPAWSGQHLVILGADDPAYAELTQPEAILARAKADGHLTVLAHPLRWKDSAAMLWAGHMPDALECHTCSQDDYRARIVECTAARLNLPMVNAGDAHKADHVNRYWIETARPIARHDDIRDMVMSGAYELVCRESHAHDGAEAQGSAVAGSALP